MRAGFHRSIYDVSVLPEAVLKVPQYAAQDTVYGPFKRTLRRLSPAGRYRVLTKEAAFQMNLVLRYPREADALPIPEFRGFVATSEGLGALWQKIIGLNGALGENLRDIVKARGITDVLEPLNTFAVDMFRFGIVAPDLHAGNLVLEEKPQLRQFYLVDGFGDRNVIPLRSMSRWANDRSLNEKLAKMGREVGVTWQTEARCFVLI